MKAKNKKKRLAARVADWEQMLRNGKGKEVNEMSYKKPGSQQK